MISIIDYGMGNLRSVQKAFELLGYPAVVTRDPQKIRAARAVVLPGVGAFREAMANLNTYNLLPVIHDAIESGKPFLGICLGLQLLFNESEEFGATQGLGIVPGKVVRFSGPCFAEDSTIQAGGLKIPHMGWNRLKKLQNTPILTGISDDAMAYFVHSYYAVPDDPSWICTTTDHGIEFCSSVCKDNIFAMQCHPEKSGDIGLRILTNFAKSI